jgi:nucleoporin NDC1
MPPLAKTTLLSSKLPTPGVSSPFGTPFGSSVVNRMAGIFDVNTCYGSPQSPQLLRRGPRLWTSASGEDYVFSKALNLIVEKKQTAEVLTLLLFLCVCLCVYVCVCVSVCFFFQLDQQMSEFSNPSPRTSVSAEGKTVRQPNVIYSWIQNKREQVG